MHHSTSFVRSCRFFVIFLLFPTVCSAQSMIGRQGGVSLIDNQAIQLFSSVIFLSLGTFILLSFTCFPFIVITLSILRQAIGMPQSPPNFLLVIISLFLTVFIMEETLMEAWDSAVLPFLNQETAVRDVLSSLGEIFTRFMSARVDAENVEFFEALRQPKASNGGVGVSSTLSLAATFVISEISRAFAVGFLVFIPFLVIDLVVAAILMSMGMMMVPPAIVSLPFKIAFFVVVDGWSLLVGALMTGYL